MIERASPIRWLLDKLGWYRVIYVRVEPTLIRFSTTDDYATEFVPVLWVDRDSKVVEVDRGGQPSLLRRAPFESGAAVVADVEAAEAVLRYGFSKLINGWSILRPRLVLHPLPPLDSEIDDELTRALVGIAANAGARETVVWIGDELDDAALAFFDLEESHGRVLAHANP